MPFECTECGASFSKKNLLMNHQRILNHRPTYTCHLCGKTFGRIDNLYRHLRKHEDDSMHTCDECGKVFSRGDSHSRHILQHHPHDMDDEEGMQNQYGGAVGKRRLEDDDRPSKKRKIENADEFYTLTTLREKYIEKFKTTATVYKVTFNDLEVTGLEDILKTLKTLFDSLIKNLTQFMLPTDLVRMSIQCPELDYPINISFTKVSNMRANQILSEIERVLQSFEQFVLDESLEIELTHVQMPEGGTRKHCHFVNMDKMIREKRCFIQIHNKDELCCARAIVTAQAKIDGHEKWNSIRAGCYVQESMAKELHERAGVPLKCCGIEEIRQFQSVMVGYQINVVSAEHFNAIIYAGPEAEKQIYLYHHDRHFDVITSMPAFLCKVYFCQICKKGYDHKEKHKCNNPCYCCHHIHDSDENQEWIHCDICNRYFKGKICFDMHMKKTEFGKCTCKTHFRCKDCNQAVNTDIHTKPHQCGEQYCKTCKEFYGDDHQCFMQTVDLETTEKEKNQKTKQHKDERMTLIFFDLECRQEDRFECETGFQTGDGNRCRNCKKSRCGAYEHKPNLCIAQRVCTSCVDKTVTRTSSCDHCGINQHVFKGPNTIQFFCKWLFSEENHGAKVLCHNFKGYDSYPILEYLHEHAILPKVTTTGSKYLSIEVPHCDIRFLDSYNFLPMALAELPEAFGITELAKGFFPHLFNRRENQQTTFPRLPELHYYTPDGMKPETRNKFMEWYEVHKDYTFNFDEELLKYCESDVHILRQSCLKFRAMFMEVTKKDRNPGIDPFEHCITIASACNLVFRRNFLEYESIGIIPSHGYRPQHKQSVKALQWIKYVAARENLHIQHALNGGEKQIGPYHVDGYYECHGEKVVLEFHGDFWHGNPKLYSKSTLNPVTNTTMGDLYMNTLDKQRYIEERGYTYRCVWECDFDQQCRADMDMKAFIQQSEQVLPLEPRDAFFGGRTEAFTLFANASSATKINYYDVTSLYPYVNKTGKIPQGHPEIITEQFEDIEHYEGLIKCRVVPPRGLYMPVLPMKCNGKLLFGLCRTCSEQQLKDRCQHTDKERAITGTWVSDELKMAIKKGYVIDKIHEVWHFSNVSQYDPVTKSGGLFTEYVNCFLKIKQEASGWPKWCRTLKQKDRYINDYFEKEGILLDKERIGKNPGLRRLAKLMLNSFWGKFGQRQNLTQSTYVTDPAEYFELLSSEAQEVKNIRMVSDDMVQLDWVYRSDFVEASARTNVVIAAYTTAQARLKLYGYLDQLHERTLYCDTDSIVFTVGPEENNLPLGDYLGDLTDEVSGNEIMTFVTGGPKNYAYTLKQPDKDGNTSCCKVRGITLNYKNSLDINFESIKRLVTETNSEILNVRDDLKICRDKSNTKLLTRSEDKGYKIVYDKRVWLNGYMTYPYGM